MAKPTHSIVSALLIAGLLSFQALFCHAISQDQDYTKQIRKAYTLLHQDQYQKAKEIFLALEKEPIGHKEISFQIEAGKAITCYFTEDKILSDAAARALLDPIPQSYHKSPLVAPVFYAMAGYAKQRKDFVLALHYLDTASILMGRKKAVDTSFMERIYNLQGQCFFHLSKMEEALNAYQKALTLATNYTKQHPNHLLKYTLAVGTVYAKKGEIDQANRYFEEAINLQKEIDRPITYYDIISLNNMGKLYFDNKRFREASNMFDKAIRLATQMDPPNQQLLGDIYINQGNIYLQITDFPKAREYYLKAASLSSIGDTKAQILINNIGYTYYRQQNYEEAIPYFQKSIDQAPSQPDAIKSMRSLAQCYEALKQLDKAEHFFVAAIAHTKQDDGTVTMEHILSLQDYGQFLLKTARTAEGIALLDQCITYYEEQRGNKKDNEAELHTNLAKSYIRQGQLSTALFHAQKALMLLESNFSGDSIMNDSDIFQSESPYELLGVLALKAHILHKMGDQQEDSTYWHQAENTYALATSIFKKVKIAYRYDESKLLIANQSHQLFRDAIELAYKRYLKSEDRHFLEMAFTYLENIKYSTLLEAYREKALMEKIIGSEEHTELQRIQKEIEKNTHLRSSMLPEAERHPQWLKDSLNATIFNLNREREKIENQLHKLYPEFSRLNKRLNVITPQKIQQNLRRGEVLLEYGLRDSTVYTFCISRKSILMQSNHIDHTYLDSLRMAINAKDPSQNHNLKEFQQFIRASSYLYDILIRPFEKEIAGKSIIIIPDGKLGYIPFEALITNKPSLEKMDYRKAHYLIKDHGISYAYSSTILLENDRQPQKGKKRAVLAYAPRYQNFRHKDSTLNHLSPIPGTSKEVETICKIYGGKAIIGDDATEDSFKSISQDYQIIHLAMHTLINPQQPSFSKLVFAPPHTDAQEDGVLFTDELFHLSLKADMAVLSACQTGDGTIHEGEGILSLARGFFYAGISSVVMTLWPVDDGSSPVIMEAFYRYLRKGYTKEQALQRAKLDLLKHNDPVSSHPKYWAGYVTIGNQAPLRRGPQSCYMIGLIGVLILGRLFQYIKSHA
ncbi:MAG: hypothetical protein CSA95_08515 [Bacteroidetes bacterium]|nr:MAG: hypothetical protein CSA95_08515 [Bacteroidota bacterium]